MGPYGDMLSEGNHDHTGLYARIGKTAFSSQDVVDQKQSVAAGVTSTIDSGYSRTVVHDYQVAGTLVVDGTLLGL